MGWWGEDGSAVDDGDGPGGVVDEVVVVAAEQDEVVQAGGAAVGPVLDVVGVGPAGGSGAAWECAVSVADDQGPS